MILTTGNKVSYPCRGPCLIGPVVKRIVDGKLREFHHLIILNDTGGELFIPLDKAETGGIRPLLDRSEIPKLLDRLKKPSKPAENWKQRARDNLKLSSSGSAFDLADIVESLCHLRKKKVLSISDRNTLERARTLLVLEISEVTGEKKSAIEDQFNKALGVEMETT